MYENSNEFCREDSPTKSQSSVRKPGESTMNNSLNGDNQIKMIDEEDWSLEMKPYEIIFLEVRI